MKKISAVVLLVLVGLVLSLGLGHGRIFAAGPPFSNGTLNGTYIFSASRGATPKGVGGTPNGVDLAGTFQFDGAGNVTGTATLVNTGGDNVGFGVQCSPTLTGTYSIDPTGGLLMALTVSPAGECASGTSATLHFTGEAVHNGHAFVFALVEPTTTAYLAGTGIEQ
jgi:hypothetical protein